MSNLSLIVNQIKSEISVDSEGKGKASIRAVARLMDVSVEAISKVLRGDVNLAENKLAQLLTEHGFDSVNLIDWVDDGIPDIAIAVIAKYYAYKAGRYCKKQAELVDTAFTGIGVRTWLQRQVGWVNQESKESNMVDKTPRLKQSPIELCQEASTLVDLIFEGTDVHPNLKAGFKANQFAKIYPALASAMEETKQLLGVAVEEKLVRPGRLAELYEAKTGVKLSSQAMNKLLADKGLQFKNPDSKNPSWLPTEQGKDYSQMVLDTAKGHNKTVQSLQWYPSVIDII